MIIKPPKHFKNIELPKVFLAGSIDNNKAARWQEVVEKEIDSENVAILNPRRDHWDSSLKESIKDVKFLGQVNWELDGQEVADLILMYFDPDTKSPITLLELGLFKEKNLIVCCPDGFWKKGNVDIVCKRYGIPQAKTLNDLIYAAKKEIKFKLKA